MVKTGQRLKEIYGLMDIPSDENILIWIKKTKKYISSGMDSNTAGKLSALVLFPDYGSTVRIESISVSELLMEINK